MDGIVTTVFALSAVVLVAVIVGASVAIMVVGWLGEYRRQRARARRITDQARERTQRAGKHELL